MCKVILLCMYNMLYMLNEFKLKDFPQMILSERVQDKMRGFDT